MNRVSLEVHKSSMIRLHIWDSWANWATMEGMSGDHQMMTWCHTGLRLHLSALTVQPASQPARSLSHKQEDEAGLVWSDFLTSWEDQMRTTNQKYWIDQAKIKGSSLELNYSNKTRSQHIEEKQLMRLRGGPSFVFYRTTSQEILQLISSWKRTHYRPTSNTWLNIDFWLEFKLLNRNIKIR